MLVVLGVITVQPDAIAGVKDAICNMETETLKEPGCDSYAFSVSLSDPGVIHIAERWQSMDDLAAHFQTPHMAAFNAALGPVEILGMDVKVYDIAGELPLPTP